MIGKVLFKVFLLIVFTLALGALVNYGLSLLILKDTLTYIGGLLIVPSCGIFWTYIVYVIGKGIWNDLQF